MAMIDPPLISAATAGFILLLQMLLMVNVGRHRQRAGTGFGEGNDPALARAIRVHGNLAENAGLFLAAFALLEMIGGATPVVAALCIAFVGARLAHAFGLSRTEGTSAARFVGALVTLLVGLTTGGYLLWLGATAVFS